MNTFDEIASGMDGQAIGPDGSTYLWHLNGMTSLYNGVVVAEYRGGIATIESNHAILRFQLAFMGVMSAPLNAYLYSSPPVSSWQPSSRRILQGA